LPAAPELESFRSFLYLYVTQLLASLPSRLIAMARQSEKRFAPSIGGIVMFAKKPAAHAFW
jgi:hypothetical protein